MATTIPATAIRILVVDDHALFRRGITALLSRNQQVSVVGDAGDAGEAIRRAQELQPDLILLDNHLPGVNGVDALPALLAAAPNARILLLTVSEDSEDLTAALRGGADGYLLKTIEGEELIKSIQRVMTGECVIAPEMTKKLVSSYRDTVSDISKTSTTATTAANSPLSTLSSREQEIIQGIVRGESNKEIGRTLGITENTVKNHVQHILRKLGVSSRVHAAVMASEKGLI